MFCGTSWDIATVGRLIIQARADQMLTLQSVIVILIGWSAIYWHWTETRLAVVIGFVAAYFVTLAILAVRETR
jgi:hypothetical protein